MKNCFTFLFFLSSFVGLQLSFAKDPLDDVLFKPLKQNVAFDDQIESFQTIDMLQSIENSTQVPTAIHFIWLSLDWNTTTHQQIPPRIMQRIEAWKKMNPHWNTVIWTNGMVQRHFPSLFHILMKIHTAAWASDLVRYEVIARYGGLYIDTDIIPLRPLSLKFLHTAFTVCEKPRNGHRCQIACNAVIASPPGNLEIQKVALEAEQRTIERLRKNPNAHYDVSLTGPRFWSKFTTLPNTSIQTLPARSFFPCNWTNRSACKAEFYSNDTDVYAMHLWEQSWAK